MALPTTAVHAVAMHVSHIIVVTVPIASFDMFELSAGGRSRQLYAMEEHVVRRALDGSPPLQSPGFFTQYTVRHIC